MKMPIPARVRHVMVEIVGKTDVPDMSRTNMTYTEAHEAFARQVVIDTLKAFNISEQKAERLAALHRGSVRERMEHISVMEGFK